MPDVERFVGEVRGDLRWGVELRLEFVEFRLFWEGHVNRGDLMDMFGISVQQASTDLNRYLGLAPDNMAYDKRAKTYVRGAAFAPLFLKPDASRYLAQLHSVGQGILDVSDAWIGQFPPYDAAPTPVRGVNATTLRAVVTAIRSSEAIEIKYQSLSRPEPRWRWISPHAVGFDGFRWHVRAYCHADDAFKDFLHSRILETRATRTGEVTPDSDFDWHDQVILEIGPHPELSDAQKNVIALDYGMSGGKTQIPVRKAFLYYALKRLGLDVAPNARTPEEQQIVLLNSTEIARRAGITG